MTAIVDVPTVEFWPPPVDLSHNGLFSAISRADAWIGDGDDRFSIGGVRVRTINYGGEASTGVWNAPWCGAADPDSQVKGGTRPTFPDAFKPVVCWAWDACDATQESRDYVRQNAHRWLLQQSQTDVEYANAVRLLSDAGAPLTSTSFLDALGQLEAAIAKTQLPGYIHASPYLSGYAGSAMAFKPEPPGAPQQTALGSTWIFGGGYVDSLEMTMVATSQPYGWRDQPTLTEAMIETDNDGLPSEFVAVAEQTFAIGYEKVIAAVTVTIA